MEYIAAGILVAFVIVAVALRIQRVRFMKLNDQLLDQTQQITYRELVIRELTTERAIVIDWLLDANRKIDVGDTPVNVQGSIHTAMGFMGYKIDIDGNVTVAAVPEKVSA